ncbi:MAG: gluconate 2-dehydrogenase subunit 3 family protein, partial [Cyclobacteriaceae bacterium]|nr:gluconate 2-dehydrogenase subunit 3 family protein [Cyclobacteriaceae bacterium]
MDIINNKIDRRSALKRTALYVGGAVSVPTILGILKSCKPATPDWKPVSFTPESGKSLIAIVDHLAPRSENIPSASELGIHDFIDKMVSDIYKEDKRKEFVDGLTELDKRASNEMGGVFYELSNEDQLQFLKKLDQEAYDATHGSNRPEKQPYFYSLKWITMSGYFNTEIVTTEVLNYVPVPGRWESCIPLEEGQPAW